MSNEGVKKILVLSIWDDVWALGRGGGVADEYHFVRRLSERGVELHFLIPEPAGGNGLMRDERLTYHTYPNIFRRYERKSKLFKRLFWPRAFDRAVAGPLRRLARELRPDVILGFTYYPLRALESVGRELGIPTAVKLFGVMNLGRFDLPRLQYLRKNFEQLEALKHRVDLYIVLNDGTLGDRALARLGVPPERIVFLPNGMDMEWVDIEVDRAAARRELGLPEDGLLVVTFSRLVDTKRVDHFIDAVSMLDPAVRRRAAFVIGGDGPMRPALERMARDKGLGNGFVFTGVIPHERIVRFLKASDVFVGTNELTNMSLPPCEAILCGVPVVAYDNAGTSEVVREGETGLLVPDGDRRALSERLALIIGDAGLRERLSKGAAAFGRRHFVSWERRIEMEVEALERLVSADSGEPTEG